MQKEYKTKHKVERWTVTIKDISFTLISNQLLSTQKDKLTKSMLIDLIKNKFNMKSLFVTG